MIKPFVDAMSVSPEGGHALFDNSGDAAAEAASPSQLTEPEPSASEAIARQHTTLDISHRMPASVTYPDREV